MYRGRVYEIREIAAAPTLEDMRRQRQELSSKLSKLMTYLVNHLFNSNLTATLAWSKVEITDHTLSVAFRDATGWTVGKFIERKRLEVADRMMRLAPDVELARISEAVGYKCHSTFVKAYKKRLQETPAEARRKPQPPEMDIRFWRRFVRGELDADAAWKVHELGVRLYPSIEERLRERYGQVGGEPRLEVEGGRIGQLAAAGIWEELRSLPFEEQKRQLRRVRFHSPALFDLLRKKSREEGRRDRRRGIELAKLALVSLEGSDDVFGERIHDLRALGWAWLGNAHALALVFPAAAAAFGKAETDWAIPRERQDQLVLARVCNLKGTFRMLQRRYDDGLSLVGRARELFQQGLDQEGEARALIQRASILHYSGKCEDSIAALEEAAGLLAQYDDSYLAFVVAGNLANVLAKTGRYTSAAKSLAQAQNRLSQHANPLGRHELDWIHGDIKYGTGHIDVAEKLYIDARDGFLEAREWSCVGLVGLDLAILNAEKGRWTSVAELATESVPILESLKQHEETLAAVKLLTEAVRAKNVKEDLLRRVRECLQRDPLVRMAQGRGPERLFRPPEIAAQPSLQD